MFLINVGAWPRGKTKIPQVKDCLPPGVGSAGGTAGTGLTEGEWRETRADLTQGSEFTGKPRQRYQMGQRW